LLVPANSGNQEITIQANPTNESIVQTSTSTHEQVENSVPTINAGTVPQTSNVSAPQSIDLTAYLTTKTEEEGGVVVQTL